MLTRLARNLALATILAGVTACVPDWDPPQGMSCEDGCSTSTSSTVDPASTGDHTPMTSPESSGVRTAGDDSTDTGTEPEGSTEVSPVPPPSIIGFEVEPNLSQENGLIQIKATTQDADGVRMALETGEEIELKAGQSGSFTGQIAVFTGLDNGEHIAALTPWREGIDGVSVPAPYYIALPDPGEQTFWETGDKIGSSGSVVAVRVLPDRRFIELGTYHPNGKPRCFLRIRGLDSQWGAADLVSVLPTAYCTATDLSVDPVTGALHVLANRTDENGVRWWLGEIASWGKGAKQIALGSPGDKAYALAHHPDMVAVCGAKKVATTDGTDAFAALVRPGQAVEEHLFDYRPSLDQHKFAETARDCAFADDTLVMVGEARGPHEMPEVVQRERLALLEYDVLTGIEKWTVAAPNLGLQSRALAVTIDDERRYHLAGYNCVDDCEPQGDLWGYLPGGALFAHTPLGPLGSDLLGPHDIAWSPAGYLVVALGELSGQSYGFKVQAFAPGAPVPLWTFTPNDKQGLQIAYAVAVDPFGKVCAGGIGETKYPAYACMGS